MRHRHKLPWVARVAGCLALVVAACVQAPGPTAHPPTTAHVTDNAAPGTHAAPPAWGHQTKFSGCVTSGAFPDPACTPGDVFPNVTKDQVCTPGYSSSVRDVPESEKNQVYAEYGIASHATGEYEVDHLVSLELGGSNDISNLFPEAASPKPGFHEKDQVENTLHDEVCNGTLTLAEAQLEIATNWLAAYETLPGAVSPPPPFTAAPSNTQAPQTTFTASGFTLTQLTSPVGTGGTASATIQTGAGAACSIGFVTPSGSQSTAQGLAPETANGNGVCAWTWKISSNTKPGTGTVTITANGATQSFPIVIQ
jgi:hypothetical protein